MLNTSRVRRLFPYRMYNATLILIAMNGLVYLLTSRVPSAMVALGLIPAVVIGDGFLWQPLSYMFVHANLRHLLFNMLGLFFFGTQVEKRIGSNEFLLFYLLTGMLAGLFSLGFYWITGRVVTLLIGASGAVYAVLLAYAALFPTANIYLFGILPIRAPVLVIGYTALEIVGQVAGRGNVAHFTHLAGFAFAYLYLLIRMGINAIQVFRDSLR